MVTFSKVGFLPSDELRSLAEFKQNLGSGFRWFGVKACFGTAARAQAKYAGVPQAVAW